MQKHSRRWGRRAGAPMLSAQPRAPCPCSRCRQPCGRAGAGCSERCAVTHFPAVFLHSDRGPSRTSRTSQLAGFSISYCSTGRMRLAFPHAHTARCDTHAHVKRTNPRRGGMGTTTRLPSHLQEFSRRSSRAVGAPPGMAEGPSVAAGGRPPAASRRRLR